MSWEWTSLVGQFGGFLVVGALTTGLDFAVYNLLTRRPPGWGRVAANVVSCTGAMSFSFTVNGHWVFQPTRSAGVMGQAMRFVLVTAASSYGLQNLVIHGLSRWWRAPVRWVERRARPCRWTRGWSEDVVARNTVKAAAVAAGLLWNFAFYREWVFR